MHSYQYGAHAREGAGLEHNNIVLNCDRHCIKVLLNKLRSAFDVFFLLLINYFDNVMTKFIVNNRTDVSKMDVELFFMITNCRIVRSRSLM